MKEGADSNLSLIKTPDGSYTLLNLALGETYHSRHGALTESRHVYIDAGLKQLAGNHSIHILEVGLGTCLNAWLTALEALQTNTNIYYLGTEISPLPPSFCLIPDAGATELQIEIWKKIVVSPWEQDIRVHDTFVMRKTAADILSVNLPKEKFQLVFFDAFAPGYQSEIWTRPVFDKLFASMGSGGILVTYCAKGEVRRTMQAAGFRTERLPGPPGKREMLRATKP